MKFGFFGGAILLVLTLIFSYIAIQNNKISREITINAFDLKQLPVAVASDELKKEEKKSDQESIEKPLEATSQLQKVDVKTESKWDKFNEKFKDFDKKFENF